MEGLGYFLRMIRRERGMTLEESHKRGGLSISYMSNIERDEQEPSVEALRRYGRGMGMELVIGYIDGDLVHIKILN